MYQILKFEVEITDSLLKQISALGMLLCYVGIVSCMVIISVLSFVIHNPVFSHLLWSSFERRNGSHRGLERAQGVLELDL